VQKGGNFIAKAKHLTKAEKETISYLHKKGYRFGKITRLVGRHKSSISRYKNYKEVKMEKIEDKKKVFIYRPDLEKKALQVSKPKIEISDRTELEELAYRLKMKRKQQE